MQQNIKSEKSPIIKNLFYKDKKDNFYFIVAKHDTILEKAFWKHLGTSGGNVSLSRENHVEEILKSKRGHLNPFTLANDTQKKVEKIAFLLSIYFKAKNFTFHLKMTNRNIKSFKIRTNHLLRHLGFRILNEFLQIFIT